MNTNITLLRGNVAAPALHASRANNFKQHRYFGRCRIAEARTRAALLMVWRTNPSSGRLERRWVAERDTATDEGVSCNDHLFQAA